MILRSESIGENININQYHQNASTHIYHDSVVLLIPRNYVICQNAYEPETVMLSKMSRTQKSKYHMLSLCAEYICIHKHNEYRRRTAHKETWNQKDRGGKNEK